MKVAFYTLGCKVNEYESEVIKDLLENNGYENSDNPDVCIINTCTVTNQADSKSRKLIRSVKKNYPNAIIVAVGCMIQNKQKDLQDLEIDIALGNKDKSKIIDYINEYKNKKIEKFYDIDDMEFENMTLNNFDLTRAYIKIQDGCDNYCAYCIIPYVRGHVRCKNKETVIKEAKVLIKNGHKEIVLTGIHTGNYHDGEYDFADLLNDLTKLEGLERLRISSIEITELNDKFLDVLKNSEILVDHMHIPLQSGSNRILKLMNRKYDKEYFIEKIEKIRKIRPNISITTDVITGFPGETEELYEETMETIKKIKFSKLHVFPYSNRKGTVADKMPNQISNEIKKERVKKLLELSKKLEIEYMNKFINKEVIFLPEVIKDNHVIGHTGNYLLVKTDKVPLNETIKIKLTDVNYPYINGVFIDESIHIWYI